METSHFLVQFLHSNSLFGAVMTPQNELMLARRDVELSEQACPHWDMESDGDAGCLCCEDLQRARARLRRARKALKAQP